MTRTMYDAVTPGNIPINAEMVAGYLNGKYAWKQSDWDRFPHAVKVTISTQARWTVGHVLDVEVGDATPAESVDWVLARRNAGVDPSVYCNLSTWVDVRQSFRARGVFEPHYWIARYDGNPTIPQGAIAKQYLNNAYVDTSVVTDYWPGVDPISPVFLNGKPVKDDNMIVVPAGVDEHINLIVKGARELYIGCSWNRHVTIHNLYFFGPTGNDPNGSGVGGQITNATIDPNRPGPLAIPQGAVSATMRYTSDHSFTIGLA